MNPAGSRSTLETTTSESQTVAVNAAFVPTLIASIFIIASCGLLYELLMSSISSYFLGSSVLHFSVTIGLFMTFMGLGSYLSRFVNTNLVERFVQAEIGIGIIGGSSAAILYLVFALTPYYYLVAILLVASVATLIGLEIPLVTRLVHERVPLRDALAQVLAFDYLGALVSSLLFPLVLLPYFGLMKTSFLIGILNLVVALINIKVFREFLPAARSYLVITWIGLIALAGGFAYSFQLTGFFERFLYEDEILLSRQTPYQRLIVTRFKDDTRLFINGDLQFSSVDEHRYHEALVHVPMTIAGNRENVLVLGAGDGLALREVLKYPDVQNVTLVDIDAEMITLAREHPLFTHLNLNSLADPRVHVVNRDAFSYIESQPDFFNVIIIDLPDPNDHGLGKLYSREFYRLIEKRLAQDGVMVTQSTSPYFSREAFWTINHTLKDVFPSVTPYTAYVPSFGQWGFNLASKVNLPHAPEKLTVSTRYLTKGIYESLFMFDRDMSELPTEVNRLDNQSLVRVYEASGDKWH